jgi:hypothetical protein
MIKELDEDGFCHAEVLDDNNRLRYQLVNVDHDFKMWFRFPHVMMFDATYNTNRFGLKLLQINGITSVGSVFPIAYGLTPSESAPFFTWALYRLKEWFELLSDAHEMPEDAFYPHVIITDFAAAARVGVDSVFPNTQKQLCTWHIGKNVLKATKERWISSERSNLRLQDFISNNNSPTEDLIQQLAEQPAQRPVQGSESPSTADFSKAWKAVMYAATVEECDERWRELAADFAHQECMCHFFFLPTLLTALSSPDFLSRRHLDPPPRTVGSCIHQALSQLWAYYDFALRITSC